MNKKSENYSLARYARTFEKSVIFPGFFHTVRNKVMSSQNIFPQNLMTITKENLENKIHLGVLSKEKNYSFVFLENWITKGRFRQENLRASKRKIRHVNLLRIIHATIISLLLCFARFASTPSVGGFWQETFLHVNSKPEPKLRSGKVDVKLLSHKSSL